MKELPKVYDPKTVEKKIYKMLKYTPQYYKLNAF